MSERKLLSAVLATEAKNRKLDDIDIANLYRFSKDVAMMESDGIPDRLQGDNEKGIGRGKYQFENAAGSNSARTAANRLANWEKKNNKLDIPEQDRKELGKKSPDFSKLSEDTQDALFFINLSMGTAPMDDIAKGKISYKEAWSKYHWAGSDADRAEKEAAWDNKIGTNRAYAAAQRANTFPESM